MEAVLRLTIPGRICVPWERIVRGCLILVMFGMLCLGGQEYATDLAAKPEGSAAEFSADKGSPKTEVIHIADAVNMAGNMKKMAGSLKQESVILPDISIQNSGIRPILSEADEKAPMNPGSDVPAIMTPVVSEDKIEEAAPVIGKDETEAVMSVPVVDKDRLEATEPVTAEDQIEAITPVSGNDRNCRPNPVSGDDEVSKTDIISKDNGTSKTDPVSGDDKISGTDPISGDDKISKTDPISGDDKVSGTEPISGDNKISKTEPTDPISGSDEMDTKDPIADETETDIPASGEDEPNTDIAATREFMGFVMDEEGYITGITDDVDITDGILVVPRDPKCVGIRSGALSKLSQCVEEVYIPANICNIEPGTFDGFSPLLYIEVAGDNSCYYSENGILCSK